MQARVTGFAIVLFWAVATSWLVWRDVVPAWTAQDPPHVVAADWVKRYGRRAQFGLYDASGHWIGGVWTRYTSGSTTDREDDVYLDDFPLLGPTYVQVKSVFDIDGKLDEIDINVLGFWNPIHIHGERYPAQFAVRIDTALAKQVLKIDLARAGTLSDLFRPFDAMPNLRVGQSWRMQVFNPLAAVTGVGDRFIPMLVRVVGREMVRVNGTLTDCLVVETSNVKAWVDRRSGVVLVQEVTLPVGGKYTVRSEPYDDQARRRAAERFASRLHRS